MSTLSRAIVIAATKHEGQLRRGSDHPYLVHPFRVMMAALKFGSDYGIVAVLHDTVEDTDLTIDDLIKEGFSKEITDAVALLTKEDSMEYITYLAFVKSNYLAHIVKILDIEDNLADQPTEKQRIKYAAGLKFLRG